MSGVGYLHDVISQESTSLDRIYTTFLSVIGSPLRPASLPLASILLRALPSAWPVPLGSDHNLPLIIIPEDTSSYIKVFSQVADELRNIFALPHNRPLENEDLIRQLPPGHHLRPLYLDTGSGSSSADGIPLLGMSNHGREGGGGRGRTKARVEELSGSVPEGSLVGGKTFEELPLSEKKSVLIDRELE